MRELDAIRAVVDEAMAKIDEREKWGLPDDPVEARKMMNARAYDKSWIGKGALRDIRAILTPYRDMRCSPTYEAETVSARMRSALEPKRDIKDICADIKARYPKTLAALHESELAEDGAEPPK